MEENGYLLMVLHTHMPFVRHPEYEFALEENWLFEVMTECYIPMIENLARLVSNGADFKITISLSPTLLSMLSDDLLQHRYVRYIEKRILLAERETHRLKNEPALLRLALWYCEKFESCRDTYLNKWNRNLIAAYKDLLDSGRVDIITSAATHAYLPLWEIYPQTVRLQIRVAIEEYRSLFQKNPTGFWLPECGYYPGLDYLLKEEGIKYVFLNSNGIWNGHPKPKYGVYAPIHTPAGIAAFGRDWNVHNLVWLKETGYPGDPFYQDYDQDIGFDLDPNYLATFTDGCKHVPTGIKYFCKGGDFGREVYDPDIAFSRCDEHANHFSYRCQQLVKDLNGALGRKPVIVGLFDTEHFGHWWREGPTWLDLAIRKLAYDQKTVKLITAGDYLTLHSTNQILAPSLSSWDYRGYSEPWLMGRNHWIYPMLYKRIEVLEEILHSNPPPENDYRTAINQYLRELLLAQSSDWAYMLYAQTSSIYAQLRLEQHSENMSSLTRQLYQKQIDSRWLKCIKEKNNIFSDVDLIELYKRQAT